MGYTKRQFVEEAFAEIGLAAYVFDLEPEQILSAVRRMDSMMALWNSMGIRLGYPLPANPGDSDPDEQTNVPDSANEAIITNLAVKIAPGRGKMLPPATMMAAKQAYDSLLRQFAMPPEQQFPGTLPLGAGNKRPDLGRTFVTPPQESLEAGPDGNIEFN